MFAPQHTYADAAQPAGLAGARTAAAFPLDEQAKYFLILVALCEPRLRDGDRRAADRRRDRRAPARARTLPDLTRAAVNHHIDYLAIEKLRVKEPQPGADAAGRQARGARRDRAALRARPRRAPAAVAGATARSLRWRRSARRGAARLPRRGLGGAVADRVGILGQRLRGAPRAVAARAAGPAANARAALKFLPGGTLSPPQYAGLREAVREEVRFHEQADHPRLIRTFETFVVDDPDEAALHGSVVLAMERAERSLQDVLDDARPPSPVAGAERLIGEICEALAHMHASGWVHGDLKPATSC